MTEPVLRPTDTFKHQVSQRCQALASFMETLLDEVSRPDLKLDLPQESELTASERDSVMLGEISPHHDYYDSKSSSETPPSYNQLNYNENMQRFFNSKPTTFGTDDAMKLETADEIVCPDSNELSPVQRFEGSGDSGSAGNFSSGSNIQMDSTTNTSNTGTGTSSDGFQPPTLTEATLVRHNDDMEKCMIKKHREARICGRSGEKTKKGPDKNLDYNILCHGVKRSGSRSWEADANKNSKHQHLSENHRSSKIPSNFLTKETKENRVAEIETRRHTKQYKPEVWPPFSFNLATVPSAQKSNLNQFTQPTGIFPAVYLMPTAPIVKTPQEHTGPPNVTPYYMAGLMYPHSHVVYPQPHVMYQPSLTVQTVSSSLGLPDQLHTNTTTNSFAVSLTSFTYCSIIFFLNRITLFLYNIQKALHNVLSAILANSPRYKPSILFYDFCLFCDSASLI